MRSSRTAAAAALLSLALILSGCGDDGTATAGGEKATSAASPKSAAASKPAISPAAKRCGRTLGDFLDSIESMANTLAVGLDYQQYLGTVNRVRSTYTGVEADRLGIVCLSQVAAPAEGALNVYIDAANEWGDCLATPSCDTDSIEPKLQREWEGASDLLAEARAGLR